MTVMKTPGVYIVEKNAFPNSVVEVATAIPAFIGYTEKAEKDNKTLRDKPCRITSMAEFRSYFGGAPKPQFSVEEKEGDNSIIVNSTTYTVIPPDSMFTLYYNMLFFYANGGGACYIVSVGDYTKDVTKADLIKGIPTLTKEQEPTMIVVPEAVNLKEQQDCYDVQVSALSHCVADMKGSRFALFDVYNGNKERSYSDDDVISNFREGIGSNYLNYGAAYYPWVNTSIVSEDELSFECIDDIENLKTLLNSNLEKVYKGSDEKKKQIENEVAALQKQDISTFDKLDDTGRSDFDKQEKANIMAHKALYKLSPLYKELIKEIRRQLNLLPVSAAMAGIFTMVDNTKGVWKAPANVSIATIISPATNIGHEEQEDLNVPVNGKSINAIRYFTGEGIKVWGARTLDGNSLDWRYINVRRTMIMLEESVKNAAKAYVFDPNDANTWVNMKSMISNFLNGIWKRGGLAGAVPDDAFSVHVGLGETMTPEDILEGIMRVTVLVAIVRPAEFIEITFQQQMQKS